MTFEAPSALDQAERAANAAWTTAHWTIGLTLVTFLLFIGALFAARYAKKTWEATQKHLAVAENELELARAVDRRREASGMTAWLSKPETAISVNVRNTNVGPLYDLVLSVDLWEMSNNGKLVKRPIFEDRRGTAMPRPEISHQVDASQLVVLRREVYVGSSADIPLPVPSDLWRIWEGGENMGGIAVALTFRDSTGLYWSRDGRGVLKDLPYHQTLKLTDLA